MDRTVYKLSTYSEINHSLCVEIKNPYVIHSFYLIQWLQNYNSQFLIPKYEINRYFTRHNMRLVKKNCLSKNT